MINVLLMSHGKMAEGMLDSAKLFFGDELEKVTALCLEAGDDPEDFDLKIKEAVEKNDDGSGTIAMCDLMGGTPSNRSVYCLSDRLQVITGMNFTMLLELLGKRLMVEDINELDINELINVGQSGIISLNERFKGLMKSLEQ